MKRFRFKNAKERLIAKGFNPETDSEAIHSRLATRINNYASFQYHAKEDTLIVDIESNLSAAAKTELNGLGEFDNLEYI